MNQLWQLWPGEIILPEVNKIIEKCKHFPEQDAEIGIEGISESDKIRKSKIRWVGEDPEISNMIMHFASEANRNAFGFDISLVRDIQYTEYDGSFQGEYDWHQDTFWGNGKPFDRKLSVVIQLSSPNSYEGGQFEIDHQYEQPKNFNIMGSVLVFPSFIRHRVLPVTRGSRKSLVAWVEGPNFR